jgi:hypothetical protein
MTSFLLLSLFFHFLFCSKAPKTVEEIALEINDLCTHVLEYDQTFQNIWQFKEAVDGKFYGESDKNAEELVSEIVDEIDNISQRASGLIDSQTVIFIVKELMEGPDSAQVIKILLKRPPKFATFLLDLMNSNHNVIKSHKSASQDSGSEEGKEVESKKVNDIIQYGSATIDSVKVLKRLKETKGKPEADNMNILMKKMELECLKKISNYLDFQSILVVPK